MPRVIDPAELGPAEVSACSLDECADALAARAFDPLDEDSLIHGAQWLRRLGGNADFLGDLLIRNLADRHREEPDGQAYGPQSIVLSPHRGNCFLRANVWPGAGDHLLAASGASPFLYEMPHDHNFHFLTLGYFGPGYESDYYEYDYDSVAGWSGEAADLRFTGRQQLSAGKLMLYRAHSDVHRQLPAASLSVSLNVMHTNPAMGWLDQYRFDVDGAKVGAIISHGSSDAFLRIAVALGGEESLDLAWNFARQHPSDRMRVTAFDALASQCADDAARDELWLCAEQAGSLMVAMTAKQRRIALA
ncbi:MAG: transposase [Novosphingobium sp.]